MMPFKRHKGIVLFIQEDNESNQTIVSWTCYYDVTFWGNYFIGMSFIIKKAFETALETLKRQVDNK